MGRWYHTEIQWVEAVPSEGECRGLSDLLERLDRDTPPAPHGDGLTIAHTGCWGRWRNPLLLLPELLSLFHAAGFPCRGRWRLETEHAEGGPDEHGTARALKDDPWVASAPDLAWLGRSGWRARDDREIVRSYSRRMARLVPADPPADLARGPRRRNARRRARGHGNHFVFGGAL